MVFILSIIVSVVCFLIWRHLRDLQLIESVTSRKRGESSERKTILKLLKMGIEPQAIFHDCYMRTSSGSYTQIDLVVATNQGLLAFEIKDYSGWLFGHYSQRYWTKVLSYGREKHRFYNPIMQNNGHIQAIRANIPHNPNIPIYSIIVFYGSCTLKNITIASDNDFIIYPSEIKRTVKSILSLPPAKFGDKYEITKVLGQSVKNGTIQEIVHSQLLTALNAGRNCPESSYSYSYFNPFSFFLRLFR